MIFNFNGYFDVSGFELEINSNVDFSNYEYIIFSSSDSQKKVFDFYKEEMQQGNQINTDNLGKQFIALTGFYDMFPKKPSWNKFKKEICPIIIYSYVMKNNKVLLTPINLKDNNEIIKTKEDKILRL